MKGEYRYIALFQGEWNPYYVSQVVAIPLERTGTTAVALLGIHCSIDAIHRKCPNENQQQTWLISNYIHCNGNLILELKSLEGRRSAFPAHFPV